MESEDQGESNSTRTTLLETVLEKRVEYEAAWKGGLAPRIEDYLAGMDGNDRKALRFELTALDLELRGGPGGDPRLEEVQRQYAAAAETIAAAADLGREMGKPLSNGAGPRFRIIRSHAKGGQGEVFLARDEELRRNVALKEIQAQFASDAGVRARFVREAEITGRLEHPGIVPVYGMGRYDDGRPYYAMRFIKGESLKNAIARWHAPESARGDSGARSREFRKLLHRFLDACNTIAYAHSRGVLHRDLKPSNIMLGKFGETSVVDWGMAKLLGRTEAEPVSEESAFEPAADGDPDATRAGRAFGTWYYMSPEQAAGRLDQLTPASDVYSLGATLYQLLTGRAPFEGLPKKAIRLQVQAGGFEPPSAVRPGVSSSLEAVCLKAMALDPKDRHHSAHALADDVELWLADEPIAAYRDAVASHEARARQHPDRLRYQEALARVRSNLGNALHFLGRNEEAVVAHRQAIAEFQVLADHDPDIADYREKLAVAHGNLGWVLKALGRDDEAEAAYGATLTEYGKLLAKSQTDCSASAMPGLTGLFVSQGWVYDKLPYPSHPDQDVQLAPSRRLPRHSSDDLGDDPPPRAEDPTTLAAACVSRGAIHFSTGAYDLAIAAYDQAIALDPIGGYYRSRGTAHLHKGAHALAIADFDRAIALDPKGGHYRSRGVAYLHLGDHDRAIADLDQAIVRNPSDAAAYYSRGTARRDQGDYDRAIADYDRAIALDPKADHYRSRGTAYLHKGMHARAIADLDQALERHPGDVAAYRTRGVTYSRMGEHDRAIADLDRVIDRHPNDAAAYHNRGTAYRDKGELDRAIADYDRAIALDHAADHYRSRGVAHLRKGAYDLAIADLDQAVALDPSEATAYRIRGVCRSRNGAHDLAIADFDQAIARNPNDAAAYHSRGTSYRNTGDFDRAIADLDQAIQLDPKASYYRSRGTAHLHKGAHAQAIADFDQAIQRDPRDALTYHNRGTAYHELGEHARAIADFDQAVALDPKLVAARRQRTVARRDKRADG